MTAVTKADTSTEYADVDLVQRALEGEDAALKVLQEDLGLYLKFFLHKKGASDEEVEELLAVLWADGLAGTASDAPLFGSYTGQAPLRAWLGAIVVNRWVTLRRRAAAEARAINSSSSMGIGLIEECRTETILDFSLMETVEQAVRQAFSACDAEDFVLLQLVHFHRISRRELCGLAGCHESGLSRRLKQTEEKIAASTLRTVKDLDPLLELTWEDFLQLCESTNLLRE